MFTSEQAAAAHAKVKSGMDFPRYVRELVGLGGTRYETLVFEGHPIYYGTGGYNNRTDAKYPVLEKAGQRNPDLFRH
ncbi:MAG: DUF1398 family protein [Bacteroidota bacterium]